MANEKPSSASGDGMLEILRAQHEAVFGDIACPQWVKDSCARYVSDGIPTGDFMRAVLANDLIGAFTRADVATAKCMAAIVGFVYRHIPSNIIGSYSVVDSYVSMRLNERSNVAEPAGALRKCDIASADFGPCDLEVGHKGPHSWMPF